MRWFAVPLLVLGLSSSSAASDAVASDSDVLRGVVLAETGEYDQAIGVLEGVVVEAPPEKRRDSKNLAVAYAYLGVARWGKGQEEKAKVMFGKALGLDKGLVLSSPKVPPHARALFEAVKKQALARAEAKQGHGSHAPLIVLGLVAAGGGAYAIAHSSTTDATPTPTKTDTLTGVLDAKQPSSSVTLGPAKAGPWTATLSYEDPKAVLQLAVFTTSSSLVTNAKQGTSTSLVADWNGADGSSYRIDWSLNVKSAQQAKYTLTVTHPVP